MEYCLENLLLSFDVLFGGRNQELSLDRMRMNVRAGTFLWEALEEKLFVGLLVDVHEMVVDLKFWLELVQNSRLDETSQDFLR